MQLAEAVDYCHSKDVVHGDIHFGNALVELVQHANGDVERRLVLADFGKSVDYTDAAQQVYADEKPLADAKVSFQCHSRRRGWGTPRILNNMWASGSPTLGFFP